MGEWGFERENQFNEFEDVSEKRNENGNVSRIKEEGKFGKLKGSLFYAGIILIAVIICSFMHIQYANTLNMWWVVLYTIGVNLMSSFLITVIACMIIVFLFKCGKKYGIIALLIFIVFFCLSKPKFIKEYEIKYDKQNCGELLINAFKDAVFNEYEIIYPTKIDVLKKTYRGSARRSGGTESDYYYLVIDDGSYVIPIMTMNEKLFYSMYNTGNLEIKVHKNTKFIYEINGVKANELTKDVINRINSHYDEEGCELYIRGNSVGVESADDDSCKGFDVGIFMPNGNMFTLIPYDAGRLYPLIAVEDGTWTVLITDGNIVCSNNIIEYDVVNGDIVDVRSVKK